MASIVKRGKSYCVVYNYENAQGQRKQKWETFSTREEANKRRLDIEYAKSKGTFIVKQCSTVEELMHEYIELYGKTQWALSTYQGNIGLIDHYILPVLGKLKLTDITPRVIEQYYRSLLEMDATPPVRFGRPAKLENPPKASRNLL